MAEEKKKRIVIASVLKPVNDTRMFGKIAETLARTNLYEIFVIGSPSTAHAVPNVHAFQLPAFERLSFARIFAPFRILKKILAIKPHLTIVTTHELLVSSLLAKVLTGCKIIYDVQENYKANILYTTTFPWGIRHVLAMYVRIKEILCSTFVNHFFLAERIYQRQLSFVSTRFTLLENKVKRPLTPTTRNSDRSSISLLFSGTLAESTGVFSAIDLATKLHAVDESIRLTIIGFAPKESTFHALQKKISALSFIDLIGGDKPVSHDQIISQIQRSDFGIISYPSNRATQGRMPTKLFEYLGYKLPILITNDERWVKLCDQSTAAVVFDSPADDPTLILNRMQTTSFYTTEGPSVFWESQEELLKSSVSKILS